MNSERVAQELVAVAKLLVDPRRAQEICAIRQGGMKMARLNNEIEGADMRLQWGNTGVLLEELPQKGKKRLNAMTLTIAPWVQRDRDYTYFNYENVVNGVRQNMKYEQAKRVMTENAKELVDDSGLDWNSVMMGPNEDQVWYLNVRPPNTQPFEAKGRDFTVTVGWKDFKAYSPSSELEGMDPSYTLVTSKSLAAARKMFKILSADPDALRGVSWNDFTKWLDRNKVKYDMQFSQWR